MSETLFDLVLLAAVWAAVAGQALAHEPGEVLAGFREIRVLTRVVAVSALVVPPVMAVAVRALGIDDEAGAGLVLYAATAAGPLGLVVTRVARGDGAVALALVALLEAANLVTIPVWTVVLLPSAVAAPIDRVLVALVAYIGLPVGVSLLLRTVAPGWAAALARPAGLVAVAGLIIIVAAMLIRFAALIVAALATGIPVAVAITLSAALAAGWAAAGPRPEARIAGALVTAQRGSATALAIAVTTFAGLPRVGVSVVVAALITLLVVSGAALVLRRAGPARAPDADAR